MRQRIIIGGANFDLVGYPARISVNQSQNVTWSAISSGRAIGNSGTRLWDTNILPASGQQLINPNSPLELPFSIANLPQYLFDAIVLVYVNGIVYPQAFSNSPDNAGIYTVSPTIADKNLFWTDLFCFDNSNSPGNPSFPANYMFGGTGKQVDYPNTVNIYFATPSIEAVTATFSATFISNLNGQIGSPRISSTLLAPGQSVYPINFSNLSQIFFSANTSYVGTPGYFRVTVTLDNSNYQSLLPFYHWGMS